MWRAQGISSLLLLYTLCLIGLKLGDSHQWFPSNVYKFSSFLYIVLSFLLLFVLFGCFMFFFAWSNLFSIKFFILIKKGWLILYWWHFILFCSLFLSYDSFSRETTNHWKVKEINSREQRIGGFCPLTPKEVGIFLRALGYPPSTLIYIAAGEIYGGNTSLSELMSYFPNIVFKVCEHFFTIWLARKLF